MAGAYLPSRLPRFPDWTMSWEDDPPGRASLLIDHGRLTVLVAADGRRLRSVPDRTGDDPGQLSPDGSRLAFLHDYPAPNVTVLDLTTGERRRYRAPVGGAEVLAWMPSGRRLLYGTEEVVFLLDAGGRSEPLELTAREVREVAVAPEGDRIAVDTGRDVQVTPLAGGPASHLDLAEGEWLCEHSWSPDGDQLVLSSERRSSQRDVFDLALSFVQVDRGRRLGEPTVVPELVDYWFLGWRTYDTIALLERRTGADAKIVVRNLAGDAVEELTTLDGSVFEVHAAAELLPNIQTAPEGRLDAGPAPGWLRTASALTGGLAMRVAARGIDSDNPRRAR